MRVFAKNECFWNFPYGYPIDLTADGLKCCYVSIPSHLRMYDPNIETPGKSFLVLGKLCEYLQQYTKIIKHKAKNFKLQSGIYDESLLEMFIQTLETAKKLCTNMSRESLEVLLGPRIPRIAAEIVFKQLFVNWDTVDMDCKFEEHEDSKLKNLVHLYYRLASLYRDLRRADASGMYCTLHYKEMWRGTRFLYSNVQKADEHIKDTIGRVSDIISVWTDSASNSALSSENQLYNHSIPIVENPGNIVEPPNAETFKLS